MAANMIFTDMMIIRILVSIPRHESKEVPTGTADNILKIKGLKKD